MSEKKLKIAVAGATGAVGGEIVKRLEKATFGISELIPLASPSSSVPKVVFHGRPWTVDIVSSAALAAADVAFLAVPPAVAREIALPAIASGCAVIDSSGVLGPAQGVAEVVMDVNPEMLERFDVVRAIASPDPLAVVLATLLAPVARSVVGLRCTCTVLHPASIRGRAGIEELSSQVVSIFNSRKPSRKVFPQGLAFDVEPACDEPLPDGWTAMEAQVIAQLGRILGEDAPHFAITRAIVPCFTGSSLSLHLTSPEPFDVETFLDWIQEAPSIHLAPTAMLRDQPRPRRSDRGGGIQVGRLRNDPDGDGIHLWATTDELVFGAAGNAIAIVAGLQTTGRL
jgi:aspartate-semialdehyde dehydrogenase